MDHVVDLDRAAAEITERRPRWASEDLTVAPTTWRDESAPWPQPLETDRSRVAEPDSIGVLITGSADAELSLVLFRGGWADVDFMVTTEDAGALPAPDVDSPHAFGDFLDRCVARVFGSSPRPGAPPMP